jgi:hypothetical protein
LQACRRRQLAHDVCAGGVEALDPLHVRVWLRDIDLGTVEIAPAVNLNAEAWCACPFKSDKSAKDVLS